MISQGEDNNKKSGKGTWKRMKPEEIIILTRYNHVMEFILNYMKDKNGVLGEYSLQEFWNWIQKERDKDGGERIEI